ncbi:MAG: class I SAM-dependent methyltransferase [bacterium]
MTNNFLNPDNIISKLTIKNGSQVADFGCGSGYFSFAAARKVGVDGKVYAVDVQKSVLSALQSKIRLNNVASIKTIWTDLEQTNSTKIKDDSLDAVLLVNVLYQSNNHKPIYEEADRVLKDGGQILIVEWKPGTGSPGPNDEQRLDPDKIKTEFGKYGFDIKEELNAGSHHFAFILAKN